MYSLHRILELFHDYVQSCLMFDDPAEEIMGFDEYAELHHGISREVANEFFYSAAA